MQAYVACMYFVHVFLVSRLYINISSTDSTVAALYSTQSKDTIAEQVTAAEGSTRFEAHHDCFEDHDVCHANRQAAF
mgnify:CR=1 FL=1